MCICYNQVFISCTHFTFVLALLLTDQLTAIQGCYITYSIRTHQQLQKAMHLFPENVVMGTNDVIPGLQEGPRDPSNRLSGWWSDWISNTVN